MNPREESRKHLGWMANKILRKFYISPPGKDIHFEIDDFDDEENIPSYGDQREILEKMEKRGAIKIIAKEFEQYLSNSTDKSKFNFFKIEILQPEFDNFYKEYGNANLEKDPTDYIKITNATLDEKGRLLILNKGNKIISFNARKGDPNSETKLFKILFHLWDLRWETKDGKTLEQGDFATSMNLMRDSGCKTETALHQQIKRLNQRFRDEHVLIKIKAKSGNYRLVVEK